MATILSDNFSYIGEKPNFQRDIAKTKSELKNANPEHYTKGVMVYCLEDDQYYTFNGKDGKIFPETNHFEPTNFVSKNKGTTAQRPKFPPNSYEGYEYYDTDLNQTIYWNGNSWENSDGTSVDKVIIL